MNKLQKRLLSWFLVIVMMLGTLPARVFADSDSDMITGAYLDSSGTEAVTVTKSEDKLSVYDYTEGGNIALPVYDIAVPEGTTTVYVAHTGNLSGSGDFFSANGSADYSNFFTAVTTTPYIGVSLSGLLDTGRYLALYNNTWSYTVALRFVTAEPEASYEIRTLTFEDPDYKGDTNYAGGTNWSSLIDNPQYGGPLLYPQGADTAYNWYDKGNTELSHKFADEWNTT